MNIQNLEKLTGQTPPSLQLFGHICLCWFGLAAASAGLCAGVIITTLHSIRTVKPDSGRGRAGIQENKLGLRVDQLNSLDETHVCVCVCASEGG